MQFYEIEMLEIPKLLFACTVELEHYRGSFHKKPRFLEILMVEHPEYDPNYHSGNEKEAWQTAFASEEGIPTGEDDLPPYGSPAFGENRIVGRRGFSTHRISPSAGSGNMPQYSSPASGQNSAIGEQGSGAHRISPSAGSGNMPQYSSPASGQNSAIGEQGSGTHRMSPIYGSGNMPPYGSMLYRQEDGKRIVVPPGMLIVTTKKTWCDTSAPPGQHQRHTTVGVEMDYRCCLHENITETQKEQLLERMRTTPGIFLVPHQELLAENAAIVRNAIGEIGARNASLSPTDRIRALAAYHSFAAKLIELVLQRLDSEIIPPAAHRYARAAKAYIHTHYREKIRVGEIAEELGISEGYLHSIFRAATGYSVLEYCNRYRVETAIQYLKGRNMTLREIALQVGLEDPYYLSRLFKKITGLSPREYRGQKTDLR